MLHNKTQDKKLRKRTRLVESFFNLFVNLNHLKEKLALMYLSKVTTNSALGKIQNGRHRRLNKAHELLNLWYQMC